LNDFSVKQAKQKGVVVHCCWFCEISIGNLIRVSIL